MTSAEVNQGFMRVKIGLAALRPAKFIVLEWSQNLSI